jgi:hypothetical protein
MLTTLRSLLAGPALLPDPSGGNPPPRRFRTRAVCGLAAVVMLSLSGCSGDSGQQASPDERVPVADMQRFPAPPDSRSLGASDEPEARLRLPLGAAGDDGVMPSRLIEGRVFRLVSMVSSGGRFETLLDHYRGLVAEGGYEVIFECQGIEDCGGARFVSEVIEDYVTTPGHVARMRTVIALTQPTSGELGHISLARVHAGATEYVGVTVSRSEKGPLTVVTQQAFVASGD